MAIAHPLPPWASGITLAEAAAAAPVQSVATRTGDVVLVVADVSGAEASANKGAASGYAELDSGVQVPAAQLGTGTPTSATVLTGARTWTAPTVAALSDVVKVYRGGDWGYGRDGDLVFDGTSNVTLISGVISPVAGVYALDGLHLEGRTFTVSPGVRIDLAGGSLRCWKWVQAAGTAYVSDNGRDGLVPTGGSGLTGGIMGRTSGAGGAGRTTPGTGVNGTNQTTRSSGGAGGGGGTGGANAGGSGGTVSLTTSSHGYAAEVKTAVTDETAGGGARMGGGGGGGGGVTGTGSSGGGGSGGGVARAFLGLLQIGASATLYVEANGGNGASATGDETAANAGGGGGGGGGEALLVVGFQVGSGTAAARALGGAGGSGRGSTGVAGSNGTNGRADTAILGS